MLIWRIVLYTLGTFFAVRSLVTLLANHERKLRRNAASERNQPSAAAGSKPTAKKSVAA